MGRVREPHIDYDGRRLVASHGDHRPRRIILHTPEYPDLPLTTDLKGLAVYFYNSKTGYGYHVAVDSTGLSGRYVDDDEIAYHCERRNTGSIGITMIGYARFTKAFWFARPRQLEKVARWLAWLSKHYDIPLVKDVEHGVSTHGQQTKAFDLSSGHWDPGFGYPFFYVLYRARKLKKTGW